MYALKIRDQYCINPQVHAGYVVCRFGIIHAPSGAAAIVFSMSQYSVEHNLLFLAGTFIAIGAAIVINNLSDHRQYPTYY